MILSLTQKINEAVDKISIAYHKKVEEELERIIKRFGISTEYIRENLVLHVKPDYLEGVTTYEVFDKRRKIVYGKFELRI